MNRENIFIKKSKKIRDEHFLESGSTFYYPHISITNKSSNINYTFCIHLPLTHTKIHKHTPKILYFFVFFCGKIQEIFKVNGIVLLRKWLGALGIIKYFMLVTLWCVCRSSFKFNLFSLWMFKKILAYFSEGSRKESIQLWWRLLSFLYTGRGFSSCFIKCTY